MKKKECNFCGYKEILDDYSFCPNCGAQLFVSVTKETESEHVKLWGGESRIATIFFVNFINTARGVDKIRVRQNVIYLADAMDEIEKIVNKYNGTANKILPDNRILAAFGIPKTQKDDPERAIECIIAIKEYYQNKAKSGGFGDWRISFGVNTGWVFFGYIIPELSYLTIIGDTVNIAARLVQISPIDRVYMSEATYKNIVHFVNAEFIGERSVKGRAEPVKIYELKKFTKEKKTAQISKFPLLGREKEFNKLVSLAQSIKEKRALKLCAITGQMGIGKTRLKEEFKEFISRSDEFQVQETYCAVEMHTSYYPFKLLLREQLNLNKYDNQATINKKIEDFVSSSGLTEQDGMGLKHLFITDLSRSLGDRMQKIQQEIFSAIRNFLKKSSQKKPLILIFEEFNRADDMSKTLTAFLINELIDCPIFILMVNFIEDARFKEYISKEIINLTPLSFDDVKRLIKFVLNCEIDEKLGEYVYKISGGNPLFVIQTLRSIQKTGVIKQDETGHWYLEKERKVPFLDDLYGVVMSGVDALPSAHRLLIDYAAVIGYSFTKKIIANLLGDAPDIINRIEYLCNEDYIIQFRGGDDPVYIFRHNLLRDVVYSTLPMKKRKEIHKKIAELLEDIYADCLSEYYEILGQQYLSCDKYDKAGYYFKLSGDKARALYSIEPAINYYNTVLRIAEENSGAVDFELISNCYLNLCDLYEFKGDIQRMKLMAEQGLESARKTNVQRWILQFSERLAKACYLLGDYKRAEELYIEAIEKCKEDMPDILSMLYSGLGLLYSTKNEPEKSLLNYNLAWVTARNSNFKEGELLCLISLSKMHQNLGNYELCLEYLNYALTELVDVKDILTISQLKYAIGDVYYQIGNIEKAKKFLQEAFNLTEAIGFEITIELAVYLALLNVIQQNVAEANYYLELVNKKISVFVREGLLAEINLKKAIIYNYLKQYERAKEFVNNALKLATKFNNKEIKIFSLILLAELDQENADKYLKQALEIGETLKFPPLIGEVMFNLALRYHQQNDTGRASYFGRKALYIFDDIKAKLSPENKETFVRKPIYTKLLEM
jgi:predicted ATPase/class 3 adenylate cyclase